MDPDREDGAERTVRKKAKVERRTLSISSAADASKGPRDSMEDSHTIRDDLNFYAVYDGHGGAEAAKLLTEILHDEIIQSEAFENGKIEDAIMEGFIKADKQILQESMDNKWDSGTTAVVALIRGTKLYIANCGDSEAVLGRRKHKSIKGESSLSWSSCDVTPRSSPPTPRKSLSPLSFSLPEGLPLIPPPSPDLFVASTTPPKISFAAREGSPCSLADSSGIGPFSNLSLASPRKNDTPINKNDNISLLENNANGNDNHNNNTSNNTQNNIQNNIQNNTQNNSQNNIPNNIPNNTQNNTHNNKHTNGNGKHHSSPRISRTNHHKKENGHTKANNKRESTMMNECIFTSLADNITQYLKDNPNSFFCQQKNSNIIDELFEPIVLTCCHRPTSEEEVQRISAAGGEIAYGMVSGELAVTRSFGDINFKHPRNKGSADFVSVKPHIKVVDLQPQDEFLILASDGLWDVLSHKEAIEMIAKCANDSQLACEELVDEALRKKSFDNVTVVFLSFKWSV